MSLKKLLTLVNNNTFYYTTDHNKHWFNPNFISVLIYFQWMHRFCLFPNFFGHEKYLNPPFFSSIFSGHVHTFLSLISKFVIEFQENALFNLYPDTQQNHCLYIYIKCIDSSNPYNL